jgi:DNA polymerase-3 subunit beta
VLVDYKGVASFMKAVDGSTVTIELVGEKIKFSCSGDEYETGTHDVDEFPVLAFDVASPTSSFQCDAGYLRDLVAQVMPFAARAQGRYAMHTVHIGASRKQPTLLNVCTTDGRQLASIHANVDVKTLGPVPFLLPLDSAKVVTTVLPKCGKKSAAGIFSGWECTVTWDSTTAVIKTMNTRIAVRNEQGEFPRFEAVVWDTAFAASSIDLDNKDLQRALRVVQGVLSADAAAVRLQVGSGGVSVIGRNAHKGQVTSALRSAGTLKGEPIEIGFNPEFMLAGLSAFKDDRVFVYMNDRASPLIVKSEKSPMVYVLMPITVEI